MTLENGDNISFETASSIWEREKIAVTLVDGRVLSVPVAWYPRLSHGTKEERNTYELMGRGTGIHWPLLDEDISVSGLFSGNPSFELAQSIQQWLDERASRNEK